ncbi:IS1016 transposase [Neisseria weaveri LMG 5135]|nr:IS1016 transposase [Neisseria weaveri LMG 5135]
MVFRANLLQPLKETEFRFNHGHDDLYKVLLGMLRKDPLK